MNRRLLLSIIAFLLAFALSSICFATCGASLALFLAGFFILTPLLPPVVLTQQTLKSRLLMAGCVVDGIGVVWLFAITSPQISFVQWLLCYLALIAYATLLSGMTLALLKLRLAPLAASATTVVCSLIWLTWPVWISPYLQGTRSNPIVDRIISIHPLFAVNGVLANLGEWSHWPIAYTQLTRLGQDISYTFPATVWPAALVHLIPGAALWWVAMWGRARAKARPSADSPSSAAAQS
jgi:hypothetical protein